MDEERFEEFSALISSVYGNIQKLKARYAIQLGLKPVHVFWIYLLRTHPDGLSASELALAGKSDRSLVSRELDHLLEQGIVHTLGDSSRRRYGWKLLLTEKGQKLSDVISVVVRDIQNTVSHDISESDLIIFYRTLHTLSDNFEKIVENNRIQEVIDNERKTDQ